MTGRDSTTFKQPSSWRSIGLQTATIIRGTTSTRSGSVHLEMLHTHPVKTCAAQSIRGHLAEKRPAPSTSCQGAGSQVLGIVYHQLVDETLGRIQCIHPSSTGSVPSPHHVRTTSGGDDSTAAGHATNASTSLRPRRSDALLAGELNGPADEAQEGRISSQHIRAGAFTEEPVQARRRTARDQINGGEEFRCARHNLRAWWEVTSTPHQKQQSGVGGLSVSKRFCGQWNGRVRDLTANLLIWVIIRFVLQSADSPIVLPCPPASQGVQRTHGLSRRFPFWIQPSTVRLSLHRTERRDIDEMPRGTGRTHDGPACPWQPPPSSATLLKHSLKADRPYMTATH